jgi:tetrahydromethanopterin S-methyltransferase subunit A
MKKNLAENRSNNGAAGDDNGGKEGGGGLRARFDDAAGRICKAVIPVRHEFFEGTGRKTAICTLGSMGLLEEISRSADIMRRVAIAGRLLSENRGIDAMVAYVAGHPELERIVVCGREVKGHRAGQALLSLHKNGVDPKGRIIGAAGPYATLKSSMGQIGRFREQVELVDLVGVTDLEKIARQLYY